MSKTLIGQPRIVVLEYAKGRGKPIGQFAPGQFEKVKESAKQHSVNSEIEVVVVRELDDYDELINEASFMQGDELLDIE